MIKKGLSLIIVLFLIGCAAEEIIQPATIVCNVPYIRHADGCCLDQNNNKICDSDEKPQITTPATPTEEQEIPTAPIEIKTRIIKSCELNDDLRCINAQLNESGLELELKNNLNNKINFHRIELKGICTLPFERFIEQGETSKFFLECKVEENVAKIYFNVLYDNYGIEQNKKESGIIVVG